MSVRSPAIASVASALLLLTSGTAALAGTERQQGKMVVAESDSTVGQSVDDSVITTKVKAALLKPDNGVSGLQVEVSTHLGEVQLSGFVDNADEARTAEQVARSIEGVKSVRNVLRVKGEQ